MYFKQCSFNVDRIRKVIIKHLDLPGFPPFLFFSFSQKQNNVNLIEARKKTFVIASRTWNFYVSLSSSRQVQFYYALVWVTEDETFYRQSVNNIKTAWTVLFLKTMEREWNAWAVIRGLRAKDLRMVIRNLYLIPVIESVVENSVGTAIFSSVQSTDNPSFVRQLENCLNGELSARDLYPIKICWIKLWTFILIGVESIYFL